MLEIANYTETMIHTPLAARPSARFKTNMYQTQLPISLNSNNIVSSRGGGGIGSPTSDNNQPSSNRSNFTFLNKGNNQPASGDDNQQKQSSPRSLSSPKPFEHGLNSEGEDSNQPRRKVIMSRNKAA